LMYSIFILVDRLF